MRLSDFGIRQKLYFGFGAVVLILAVLLGSAYTNLSRLDEANGWNNHTHEVIAETQFLLESLLNMETGERGFALTGDEASLAPLGAGQAAFKTHLAKTRSLTADNAQQQERLARLEQAQAEWFAHAVQPVLTLRRAAADQAGLDAVLAFEKAGKGRAGMDGMRALLNDIGGAEQGLLEQRARDALALQRLTNNTLLFGGLLAVGLAMLLARMLSRSIVPPLEQAVAIARQVAAGDLSGTIRADSRDETGQMMQALAEMKQSLLNIVGEVRKGTDTIANATGEIARGNQDLSARTEQQASSLEETASSMEELTGTVRQNADNARAANQLASAASDVARKGGVVVSQVVGTMDAIKASSSNVVDIIGVIDSIAFQTNILALNAAVEAARAGEQGRGFAVVATEVRNLAQRSATAAKEIKALIDDSVSKVEDGSRLVNQAGETMAELVASVERVTTIIEDIASASSQQIGGIEQINAAITQMDTVTQQNAALVEQAAAAAEALQEQASNQSQVVSVFRLDEAMTAYAAVHRAAAARPSAAPALRAAPVRKALAGAGSRSAAGGAAPQARRAAADARSSPARRAAPPETEVRNKAAVASKPAADDWEEF
ncbi:methyl-accepting chemotaxis protein [Massilia sp. MB5]|uniref:methyl-accepting chemotaxis protein n=1 Tax=Massilia sp. MB5 TaxID=2919578 RepID=UPI001F0FEFCD|nr:methyl-accepting chemotaxis protein [Massilia sp. MB5]UMR30996.1 methyl-accepting chemotaxis protein [Massilia sp. MB5]